MKVAKLSKLAVVLRAEWSNFRAPELFRVGESKYLVAEAPLPGSLVYGAGFKNGAPFDASTKFVGSWADRLSNPRTARVVVLVAVGLVLATIAFSFAVRAVARPQEAPKAAYSQSKKPSAAASSCFALASLKPAAAESQISDIVIGGLREQTASFTCGKHTKTLRVRFAKNGNIWKAESAIPVGSHFQK